MVFHDVIRFFAHKTAHLSLAIYEDVTEDFHQVWQTYNTDHNAVLLGMIIRRYLQCRKLRKGIYLYLSVYKIGKGRWKNKTKYILNTERGNSNNSPNNVKKWEYWATAWETSWFCRTSVDNWYVRGAAIESTSL